MIIPGDKKALAKLAARIAEDCRAFQGARASAYRQYGQWIETGRAAGQLATANLLYGHVDRLASHLFSPSALRFSVDFENHYGQDWLKKAEVAARVVTREWERRSIDLAFGLGVRESLVYGAAILKQLVGRSWDEQSGSWRYSTLSSRLVMPWQFGVLNETRNELDQEMEAVCETVYLTKHEIWRRIAQLPDAARLFKRILAAAPASTETGVTSFMHEVLSTAILDVSLKNATNPQPGGIVQLSNNPSQSVLGPQVSIELFPMHEIWAWDDVRGDWTTIQLIEPDILIAPLLKRTNLFCPNTLPYTLIQANQVAGYFWGRSEITDLMRLQSFLSDTMDDVKRMLGVQFDKVLAFPGMDGLTDELYAQFRSSGYIGMPPGSDVKDLTPRMPDNAMQIVEMVIQLMDRVSGFPPILSGQGETGVRAGVHADTLQRNASPRLRDRALLVERQCAEAGDATLCALEAKDPAVYWTEPGKEEETAFYLSQLPKDRRISVDSHSSSPVYEKDHQQQVYAGLRLGLIDPESAIEMLDLPAKDLLVSRLRAREAKQAALVQKLIETDPAAAAKALMGPHHRR